MNDANPSRHILAEAHRRQDDDCDAADYFELERERIIIEETQNPRMCLSVDISNDPYDVLAEIFRLAEIAAASDTDDKLAFVDQVIDQKKKLVESYATWKAGLELERHFEYQ